MSAATGWRGCPCSKPKAQVLNQQPRSLQPRTSLEDKASPYRSACRAGSFRKLVARQPPASVGSRQEHGGKRLSGADSETKPFGALWVIAGFATAEICSEPDAEMPCHPREQHRLLLPGGSGRHERLAELLQPGASPWRQELGGLRDLRCPCSG